MFCKAFVTHAAAVLLRLSALNRHLFSSLQNPESLDSSIQSALSALFPPFEVTAPIVLSQLFRSIEERYHGDALQCLLDFLIPSKHLLESVQQAACVSINTFKHIHLHLLSHTFHFLRDALVQTAV